MIRIDTNQIISFSLKKLRTFSIFFVNTCNFRFFLVLYEFTEFGMVKGLLHGMVRLKATSFQFPEPVDFCSNSNLFSSYDLICPKSTSQILKNHM